MAAGNKGKTKQAAGRGAKAPRSAFRSKPGAKPAKPKPKAKAVAKAKAKTKPVAKAKAKVVARTKSVEKAAVKAKPKAAANAKPRAAEIAAAPANEVLGVITCPSGKVGIFDIGLFGYLPRPALEPAIVKADVPADRELSVIGTRVGRGRFGDCWDHVSIQLGDGAIHTSKKLGEAGVDFARLVCVDHASLDQWQHDDSLDGLADVMFWGRDEAKLAKAMRAPRTREGYGWSNLTVDDAEAKLLEAERLKAQHKLLLATDFRPHSHHFHALAAARANPKGAGEIDLGSSRMLLFFTSWGDGVYPIYLDLDSSNRPVRVRIQLATAQSNENMRAVNP
ncbi:MAG: hypothetical protein IPQ07_14530 [Myxococcales bacterium]|nr:hypothetical protein [Myxococcales bacterium]